MKVLILVCALLPGCATFGPKTVEIPVAVSCVDEIPARPALVSDAELKVMNDYQLPLALHRDRKQREGYMRKAEALLLACKVMK